MFDLARSIEVHQASATRTGERAVAGRTAGMIELNETVTWEARHFGIKQRLTVMLTGLDRPKMFEDEMVDGAFASMRHVHRFEPAGGGTVMRDEFSFAAPLGILGRVAERLLLTPYMTRFLTTRNSALKQIAESDEWTRYLPAPDLQEPAPPLESPPPRWIAAALIPA